MDPYRFDLRDYVKIYPDALSQKECKKTIKKIEKKVTWDKHNYYDANKEYRETYDNDLYVGVGFGNFFDKQNKLIWNYIHDYIVNHIKHPSFCSWSGYTRIRYNRYNLGEEMRNHVDHISSIFDGTTKGVPIITVLGALNDDYEGGKFIMFNDFEIKFPAGTIMVFPSSFLFPHLVTPITKGTRYSFVSWVW